MFKKEVPSQTFTNEDDIVRIFPLVYFVIEESTSSTFFPSPSDTSASLLTDSSPEEASAKLNNKKAIDKWEIVIFKGND